MNLFEKKKFEKVSFVRDEQKKKIDTASDGWIEKRGIRKRIVAQLRIICDETRIGNEHRANFLGIN